MARLDAPSAFRSVTLRDRYTWHRATLQEWLDMRSSIIERLEKALDWDTGTASYQQGLDAATKMLWIGEARAGRPTDVPIEGELKRRHEELLESVFVSRASSRKLLNKWEREFLRQSTWLKDMHEEYRSGFGRHSMIGLLVEWIAAVEIEFNVARVREKTRQDDAAAIAEKGRVRTRHRRHPYYPAPIELLGIWRSAVATISWIQWSRRQASQMEMSRGADIKSGHSHRRIRRRKPRGSDHIDEIGRLVDSLRTQGFKTAITLDELLAWRAWERVYESGCSTFATSMLAKLFRVRAVTVNRDLTAGVLRAQYKKYRVPKILQDFRTKPGEIRTGVIREQGWYLRERLVVEEVYPGHAFFPPPAAVK